MMNYYTPDEVAAVFRVTRLTVYRWIAAGKLDALKVGRGRRIAETELVRLMRDGMTPKPDAVEDPEALEALRRALNECAELTPEQRKRIYEQLKGGKE